MEARRRRRRDVMTRKAFTVDEANGLIPVLADVFREIDAHRRRIREAAKKLEVLELLWGGALRDVSNPDHVEFSRRREEIDRAMRAIQSAVEHGLIARGLRLPAGGLEEGLVDFPTTYQGRWVYLCWHVGEHDLRFWHETDAGFAGRRKITEAQRREMGTEESTRLDDSPF
jgi:hypothetical protein